MKSRIFVLALFLVANIFSQNEVYFFKDADRQYSVETIQNVRFDKLDHIISDGYNKASYWFKIPNLQQDATYYFRINNPQIHNLIAFQNGTQITKSSNERYATIKFIGNSEVLVKVIPRKESYFSIDLLDEATFLYEEKTQILLNGFYYGVSVIIAIFYIIYFFLLKDDAYLYYALLLLSVTLGIFIRDGMLNFIGLSLYKIDILVVFTFSAVGYFASKFSRSFLQVDLYYPKIKFLNYGFTIIIFTLGVCNLITGDFKFLVLLSVLVFTVIACYWVLGLVLFKKNIFTKIYVLAFLSMALVGINNYLLKYLGLPFIYLDAIKIKIGSGIVIAIFSSAIIYRMKTLKDDNNFMRAEIINYSSELAQISEEISNKNFDKKENYDNLLSMREHEIFNLIVKGKTNKEIANELNVSINTVKFHIKNVYEKLQVKSRKEVLSFASSSKP